MEFQRTGVSISKLNYKYDDPNAQIYIKRYDYSWWATSFDKLKKYLTNYKWLLIGSAGNPAT